MRIIKKQKKDYIDPELELQRYNPLHDRALKNLRRKVEYLPVTLSSVCFDVSQSDMFRYDLLGIKTENINFTDNNGNKFTFTPEQMRYYTSELKLTLSEKYTKIYEIYLTIKNNLSSYPTHQSILSTYYYKLSN